MQNLKKEKDKKQLKFYSDKLLKALANDVPDYRQNADVVRDLKQVQNTLQRQHIKLRSSDDEIYHLIELNHETDFIHDIVLSPYQIVTYCFSKRTNFIWTI